MKHQQTLAFLIALFLGTGLTMAQEASHTDTLDAAVISDSRILIKRGMNELSTDMEVIRSVASPLGEGDAIRWAMTLPGVSSGADGTNAFYVRGSNMGNTLFSIDGVQVYGYSHLLGLTTIVPNTAIANAMFEKGGFDASEGNFTAAHLSIKSRCPEKRFAISSSLNNFMADVSAEGKFKNKLSYLFSFRISPLTLEYKAFRQLVPSAFNNMSDFSAGVGDIYGKIIWNINRNNVIELFGLGSTDSYQISMDEYSHQGIGWDNKLAQLRYTNSKNGVFSASISFNTYENNQREDKLYRGQMSHLSMQSTLDEITARFDRCKILGKRERIELSYGAKYRHAGFNPGQVGNQSQRRDIQYSDAYLQINYRIPDKLSFKGNVRYNYFYGLFDGAEYQDPTGSTSIKWDITKSLAIEGTYDHMVQYYHLLEGLPVGWSVDMMVPSGRKIEPETTSQSSISFSFNTPRHKVSLGAFYKEMDNLIIYKYSQALFNGGMQTWESDVETGRGLSYGAELLYEYSGDDLYTRLSYTLSKTSRSGFRSYYDGGEFHAKFDRPHVLNILGQWKDFSAMITLQSGHWEHGAAEMYTVHQLGDVPWNAKYYSGIYNYQMPTVFRLDVSYHRNFKTKHITHDLNVGIYNLTNHFNPFMLYFNAKEEKWNAVALLPIMPNFSYRITF